MSHHIRYWSILVFGLGAAMLLSGIHLQGSGTRPPFEREGLWLVAISGFFLCVMGLVGWIGRKSLGRLTSDRTKLEEAPAHCLSRPYLTLFLASFVSLFVEVMLIRYCGSQIRIFSFYKNVPLVACFLGLGLGCWKGHGRPRQVFVFLLWLIPLTFFLAHGSRIIDGYLGGLAAQGSSEHILGDVVSSAASSGSAVIGQILMGLFCVATLVIIAGLFTNLGRFLGDAFEATARIEGYSVNILASLAGVVAFGLLSVLWTPPWVWFAVGLLPLVWWLRGGRQKLAALLLAAVSCVVVVYEPGEVVWSPYQKLVGHKIPAGPQGTRTTSHAYLVQISDVFYQVAMDLRPEVVDQLEFNPYPHYDHAFDGLERLDRVLVVGSGTGNDVASALRAGAKHVDAVDIDPAIVAMGRENHPELPYDDPRVTVIIDDARRSFRYLPKKSYDAVVFGLLDSHTQLGISSVRLDNYVFTMESLTSARALLRPGGKLIVTAATFREWFHDRFVAMLSVTCQQPVNVDTFGAWHTYSSAAQDFSADTSPEFTTENDVPVDDWPFLYLPKRGVPTAYLIVVAMLALASVAILRYGGLRIHRFSLHHGHLFFLGSAFLLMEVVAINRLALLFGTTWIVSAVAISIVLILIVAANLTVLAVGSGPYSLLYTVLFLSLGVSYLLEPSLVLGKGPGLAFGYGLLVLSPVYFAGLVFAKSFRTVSQAGPAIGANILGAVLGGWVEYTTMAIGIRTMVLLAMGFYLMSLVMLTLSRGERANKAELVAEELVGEPSP
ncbi:MAG: methyltransferase domain-containing protein [bacterium]|nr:methyltransferase domain-containing protein [bacterium]